MNMSIKINDKAEAKVIQKALFAAGGQHSNGSTKPKEMKAKFLFISEDLVLTCSSDRFAFEKRSENEISVFEAIEFLDSLVNKEPFLQRSGTKVKPNFSIDSFVKNQFNNTCTASGLNFDKRLENLIAADIKCRIHGLDLIEVVKKELRDKE